MVEGSSTQLDHARCRVLRSLVGYERTEIFLRWPLVSKATIVFRASWQLLTFKTQSPPVNGRPISSPSIVLPGDPGGLVTEYPEGYVTNCVLSLLLLLIDCRYNAAVSGPSGNITVNGQLTYGAGVQMLENNPNRDNDAPSTRLTTSSSVPPYAIHNGKRPRVPILPLDQHLSLFPALQSWAICPYRLWQPMRYTTVVVQSSRCIICLGI